MDDQVRMARRHLHRGPSEQAHEALEALRRGATDDVEWRVLALELAAAQGQVVASSLGLEQITRTHPELCSAWLALGRTLVALGDGAGARAAADRAVALACEDVQASIDLAWLRRQDNRMDEALSILRRAAARAPGDADVHLALADALLDAEDGTDAARAAMSEAITLDPGLERWHLIVSSFQGIAGKTDAARRTLERGVLLRPDDLALRYLRDVAVAPEQFDQAPPEYVAAYFDDFADQFDGLLTDRLAYRTPGELVARTQRALDGRWSDLDVLDAGCGTGLCGPLLRTAARQLDGVDLSGRMLEKAAERGIYDRLDRGDLIPTLTARPNAYDVIVAADVFIYFGDLVAVLRASAAATRRGGLVAFSAEIGDEPGVAVLPSGRFAHHRDHVIAACAAAGLEPELTESVLRTEGGSPVMGYLVTARRA